MLFEVKDDMIYARMGESGGFVCAKLIHGENPHALYYTRAKANRGRAKLEDFEIEVYTRVVFEITAKDPSLEDMRFKIFNLSLDREYYLPISEVAKARVNGEKYVLRIGDLRRFEREEPKTLAKSKERIAIQKKNKEHAKAARHNEELRYRGSYLYQYPMHEDPRDKGAPSE